MSTPSKGISKEQIIDWLLAHKDFFQQHPELMSNLEFPANQTAPQGTTSLAEFQARRMGNELAQLKEQLATLSAVATENENIMHRMHVMTLHLMSTPSLPDFFDALFDRLSNEFDAAAISLHLHRIPQALQQSASVIAYDNEALAFIDTDSKPSQAQCGRFTQAKLKALFPNKEPMVRSAALVPVRSLGVLAIGSEDQSKYQPQMGSLFLELLASTLCFRLEEALADDEQNDTAASRA